MGDAAQINPPRAGHMITRKYHHKKNRRNYHLYSVPEGINAVKKRKVLKRLNSLRSEGEIMDIVQTYTRQGNIGRHVAHKILKRRNELGEFKTLQELATTPGVGPGRFAIFICALCNNLC